MPATANRRTIRTHRTSRRKEAHWQPACLSSRPRLRKEPRPPAPPCPLSRRELHQRVYHRQSRLQLRDAAHHWRRSPPPLVLPLRKQLSKNPQKLRPSREKVQMAVQLLQRRRVVESKWKNHCRLRRRRQRSQLAAQAVMVLQQGSLVLLHWQQSGRERDWFFSLQCLGSIIPYALNPDP